MNRASRVTPRLIIGLAILILGVLWTLDNMDVLESEQFTQWWPLVIIAIGLLKLFQQESKATAAVLIAIGALFLLGTLDIVDLDIGDLFPLAIALFGAKIVFDALGRRSAAPRGAIGDASSTIHAFATMAGVRRQSTSDDFRGGDVNAIMGGVELDLRNAQVKAGEPVVLDALAFMGGVEIFVPPTWKVVGSVMPLMGAFEDNTRVTGAGGPTLTVRGVAFMGAIEVKN